MVPATMELQLKPGEETQLVVVFFLFFSIIFVGSDENMASEFVTLRQLSFNWLECIEANTQMWEVTKPALLR